MKMRSLFSLLACTVLATVFVWLWNSYRNLELVPSEVGATTELNTL